VPLICKDLIEKLKAIVSARSPGRWNQLSMLSLASSTCVVVLSLVGSSAKAEEKESYFLRQRTMGIEQAERLVVRHLAHDEISVKFGRVRYYEHYSIIEGKRILTAQVVCGRLTEDNHKPQVRRSFLSWMLVDPATRQFTEQGSVVAIHHQGDRQLDFYTQYHLILCRNAEDGEAITRDINVLEFE
jgi:hypothetical protein